eukprot:sb/3462561/
MRLKNSRALHYLYPKTRYNFQLLRIGLCVSGRYQSLVKFTLEPTFTRRTRRETSTAWCHIALQHDLVYPGELTVSSQSVWMIDSVGHVYFHKGAEVYLTRRDVIIIDANDESAVSRWTKMPLDPDRPVYFKSASCGPRNQVRRVILDQLRDIAVPIRDRRFDDYHAFVEGSFRLKSAVTMVIKGVQMRCTALLSKNLPHGHLNIQYYELGGGNSPHITSEENPEMERGEARRYEQTYDGGPDSIAARERRIRIPVSFITGVKKVSPNEKQLTLRLYTKDDTYRITFERDTDYKNWFDSLNDYIRFCHHVPQVPHSQSVWALTSDGDVYFSPPAPSCVTDHSKRPWLPIEGNIIQVTAGPRQVVWGLTPDFELYYFTKGYGGGDMPLGERLENCSITRRFEIRENQRYKILNQQFLACGNNDKRDHWVDRSGNKVESDNQYRLPGPSWRWVSLWQVHVTDNTDTEGWMYARNFHSTFSPKSGMGARKRYKYRIGRLEVSVETDHPLVDISVDAFNNLWAVCEDGSAYFSFPIAPQPHPHKNLPFPSPQITCWVTPHRMGISKEAPRGTKWRNIVKPDRSENLIQISAGQYGVWAVAASGRCYIRLQVGSAKEWGSSWELVDSEPMVSISVNGSDQVFGIRKSDRAVVTRRNITGENLAGEGWSVVLEDRWGGVSITATSQHHHWDETDEELLQLDNRRRYRSKVVELLQV